MPDAGENFEATFEPTDSPAGRVIDATQDEPTPTLEFEAPDSLPVLAVSRTLDTAHPDSAVEYSASAVDYFSRTAFGVEYGESEPVLHKWTDDLRISVLGTPTVADLATLRELIDELNILLPDLELRLVDQHANVEMHILPETEFKVVEPEYVETNSGLLSGVVGRRRGHLSGQDSHRIARDNSGRTLPLDTRRTDPKSGVVSRLLDSSR